MIYVPFLPHVPCTEKDAQVYRNAPDVHASSSEQMTCEPNYSIAHIQSLSKERWLIRPEFHIPCMMLSIAIVVLYILELRVVLRYRRYAPFTSTYFRVWTMQVRERKKDRDSSIQFFLGYSRHGESLLLPDLFLHPQHYNNLGFLDASEPNLHPYSHNHSQRSCHPQPNDRSRYGFCQPLFEAMHAYE